MALSARQRALAEALEHFAFDPPGSELTFTQRLARDNGWTGAFAARVIEEYKRFLILATTLEHPASPSDEVDQAWHLHLTHTRNYWQALCEGILGSPLHHDPSQGGAAELARHRAMYLRTLDDYRQVFDAAPPEDIWPDVDLRFRMRYRRVRVEPAGVRRRWWR
jgi:hypothetical protein